MNKCTSCFKDKAMQPFDDIPYFTLNNTIDVHF